MAAISLEQMLRQRIKARKNISDDEASASSENSALDLESPNDKPAELGNDEDDTSEVSPSSKASITPDGDPSNISFGALARAQDHFGKRKRLSSSLSSPLKRLRQSQDQLSSSSKSTKPTRTSKHAPTALSSKRAVTRRREVVAVPRVVHRDPRFDPLTGPLDNNRVAQTYSFLADYQSSEIAQLKSAIRSTKDLATRERLQKALKRMESRKKADVLKEERQNVVREHRKQEKERVKEGKTPFYLKKGDVKTKMLEKRFEGMGPKKIERVMERRRKKMAGKDKKLLPQRRRVGDEG